MHTPIVILNIMLCDLSSKAASASTEPVWTVHPRLVQQLNTLWTISAAMVVPLSKPNCEPWNSCSPRSFNIVLNILMAVNLVNILKVIRQTYRA